METTYVEGNNAYVSRLAMVNRIHVSRICGDPFNFVHFPHLRIYINITSFHRFSDSLSSCMTSENRYLKAKTLLFRHLMYIYVWSSSLSVDGCRMITWKRMKIVHTTYKYLIFCLKITEVLLLFCLL